LQVQRQLQLRIEAQGKYLQKIIEEQQRINGAGVSRATSSEQLTKSERPNSSTHVPASPTPLQAIPFSEDNGSQVEPMKTGSQDIPNGEPQTPDTNCRPDSPRLSPKHERPAKRQRGSSNNDGTMFADGDFTLPHHIFESSTGSEWARSSNYVRCHTQAISLWCCDNSPIEASFLVQYMANDRFWFLLIEIPLLDKSLGVHKRFWLHLLMTCMVALNSIV